PEADRSPAGEPPKAGRRTDLLAAVLSLAAALWLTTGLWVGPNHRVLRVNASDQALFEWLLSYAAHAVTHLHNPLWTDLLNAPMGVNLAVNTADTVEGVLLAPVTLTLGAPVAFTVALTLNLALSAFAWYLFLARSVRVRPAAALVGGLFCGFAPAGVAHANGHLNFTAQFLLPLILARVWALRRPGNAVQDGAIVGLLVAAQYSLGAEALF